MYTNCTMKTAPINTSNGNHGFGRSLMAANACEGAVKMLERTPTELLSAMPRLPFA